MRFVPPVAALADGAGALRRRPARRGSARWRRPWRPCARSGSSIDDDGRGALPFTVHGAGSVAGGVVELDASSSSQFVSALLLAGARYDAGVDVRHVGKPVPSLPHIEMTVSQLRARGVAVDDTEPDRWVVAPRPDRTRSTAVVEPDLSNAAPFLAAALVTGGRVRVRDWPLRTDQAGDQLRAPAGGVRRER